MSLISKLLINLTLIVFSMGLVMVYNTTSGELLDRLHEFGLIDSLLKQASYGLVATLMAFIVYRIGHQNFSALRGDESDPPFLLSLVPSPKGEFPLTEEVFRGALYFGGSDFFNPDRA